MVLNVFWLAICDVCILQGKPKGGHSAFTSPPSWGVPSDAGKTPGFAGSDPEVPYFRRHHVVYHSSLFPDEPTVNVMFILGPGVPNLRITPEG